MNPVTESTGLTCGKVVAVHLSHRSRAAQRGRVPAQPSYFLKPASSLSDGGVLARPEGTELLGFEGEIAVVMATAARNVAPEEAWSHVGWVTAANDLGLHDLRRADRGSNVRSKGGDGMTPVGPSLLPVDGVEPGRIEVRTWVDGELVQADSTDGMLFPIGLMVADLSRFMTLEPGDVILTGTPAGASVVRPGQRVEVEVGLADGRTTGRLVTDVVEGPALAPWGELPSRDPQVVADAWGEAVPDPLTPGVRERLERVAVATLSAQLRRRGYDQVSLDGLRPVGGEGRLVGRARTLLYLPYRPDLFESRGGGFNAQKQAVDSLGPGDVLVMGARGDSSAGTLGDILALRAMRAGAAGVVTDGAVRDRAAVAATGLPVWSSGAHPAVLGRRHFPAAVDVELACGGATVQVGDVIVADADGPVVIPPHLLLEVLEAAEEQEALEEFITQMVDEGHPVRGLYPPDAAWRARYERWRAEREPAGGAGGGSTPPGARPAAPTDIPTDAPTQSTTQDLDQDLDQGEDQ